MPCCRSSVALVPTLMVPAPIALVWLPNCAVPFSTQRPPEKVLLFVSTTTLFCLTAIPPLPDSTPFIYRYLALSPQTSIHWPLLSMAPWVVRFPLTGLISNFVSRRNGKCRTCASASWFSILGVPLLRNVFWVEP